MKSAEYTSTTLLIDGEWIRETGASRDVINPATGGTIGAVPLADSSLIERAIDAATTGFDTWRRTPLDERARILTSAAAILRSRLDEASRHMTLEQGKPLAESRAEFESCAALLEWCPGEAAAIHERSLDDRGDHHRVTIRKEPIGPVAAFSPWNFPASLATRKVAAALSVGCSMVLKPAEETPASFGFVAAALQDAGLPPGVMNVIYGVPAEVSSQLIDSPAIRKIAFTGSTVVGRELATKAGAQAKPCVLELGGHAPVIICDDADIELAAKQSAAWKFRNCGQVCIAPTRYYVHSEVFEAFVDGFTSIAGDLCVGDGLDSRTRMGPVANIRRREFVDEIVCDAREAGAAVRLGGMRSTGRGAFYRPTVLTDTPATARIMREEPFGPVAAVNRFENYDEVIEEANGTPYALAAYVFSRSVKHISMLSRELDAGMVGVNGYQVVFPDTPIGGRRSSGYGSEGGREGIDAYLVSKLVSEWSGGDACR